MVYYKGISMLVSIYTVTWYESFQNLVMQPCQKVAWTLFTLSMRSKNKKLLALLFYETTSISDNNYHILESRTAFEIKIVPLQSYDVDVLHYGT